MRVSFVHHCISACLGAISALGGSVTLAPVFSDHMVLQREVKLPVWGTADPGQEVRVAFNGATASTVVNARGEWKVELPAQRANGRALTLEVWTQNERKLVISDVLLGDVWICAGQSNMEFRCNQESSWATEKSAAEIPEIRLRNGSYAGQGYFGTAYPAAIVARQTPESFYNESAWLPCNAENAGRFSAVGYFFAKEMRAALNVPIGMINLSVGGSPTEAWVSREALRASPVLAPMLSVPWWDNRANLEPWCIERAKAQLDSKAAKVPGDDLGPHHSFKPSFLWSTGPARLAPFAIRGVLWYQGESNALSHLGEAGVSNPRWRVDQHEELFPALVADWRRAWGQGEFPFLVCQLSSIGTERYAAHFWPEFRDQQRRLAERLPNVGLAVTSDLGHPTDVHPKNKRDVGKRLANWARRYVHGDTSVLACPLPQDARRDGKSARVKFRDAGVSLTTSQAAVPAGFEIAGADGVFVPATARISGDSVLVSAEGVSTPASVRYGWQPYSSGNLTNAAGLPASTFTLNVAP